MKRLRLVERPLEMLGIVSLVVGSSCIFGLADMRVALSVGISAAGCYAMALLSPAPARPARRQAALSV